MKIVLSHLSRKSECERVSIISFPKCMTGPEYVICCAVAQVKA